MPKINCQGLQMYYEFEGSGIPVVMIAGLTGDHTFWGAQAPALAAAGYRCLVFDSRDVGQTDQSPASYDIRQFADDTVELMTKLGIGSAHIVGASMGGAIAQEMAIKSPERVSSLTLVCTVSRADVPYHRLVDTWRLLRPHVPLDAFVHSLGSWLFTCRFFEQPEALEGLLQMIRDNPFPQTVAGFQRQCEALLTHDAHDRLRTIKSPTHVIVGAEDMISPPRYSRALTEQIPGARLTVIPASGHALFWEKPAEFNQAVIDFLKEQSSPVST